MKRRLRRHAIRIVIRAVMVVGIAMLVSLLAVLAGIVGAGLGFLHDLPAAATVGLRPAIEVYAALTFVVVVCVAALDTWWSKRE